MSSSEVYVRRAAELEGVINRLTWALDDHPDTGAVDEYRECSKLQEVGRETVSWLRGELARVARLIKAADDGAARSAAEAQQERGYSPDTYREGSDVS